MVTGVTFFLVHDTASGGTEVLEIGRAKAVRNILDLDIMYAWEFTADTSNWPVIDDERVMLLARTELGDTHGPMDWVRVGVTGTTPGDFNRDGVVDTWDFLDYQTAWQAGEMRADMNGDGEVDILDFVEFQSIFDTQ